MDCLYRDCPLPLGKQLIFHLDLCTPECFWRRRFIRLWMDHGLNTAYADFLAEAPKYNPHFLPMIERTVEEIREWRSRPFPS